MESLLSKVGPSDVIVDPFPHVVVEDALDARLYDELARTYPRFEELDRAGTLNNKRVEYKARDVAAEDRIHPLWKAFVETHTSPAFYQEVLRIFRPWMLDINPSLEEELGPLEGLRVGTRHVDRHPEADVLLDAMVAINTPVLERPSSVRRTHVNLADKLFSGHFYMRAPDDTSAGGDFEIYRFRGGKPCGFSGYQIAEEGLSLVKTVRYARNVLVFFPNSIHAVHGVSPRSVTGVPRYVASVIGQIERNLFDTGLYQEPPGHRAAEAAA